jgi:uncharacterized membrane protein YedE/YeeE
MLDLLRQPWPWWVVGPLVGLLPALLLLLGNRLFGLSSNLRHACAAFAPGGAEFFRYDWRREGGWNLAFALGTLLGGFVGGVLLANPEPVAIAARTRADLEGLGLRAFDGLVPADVFSWGALATVRGFVCVVIGGFLVGFGTAWAGGCTSGHGLTGVADLQPPSFLALAAFFAGGIAVTRLLLPLVFGATGGAP